MHPLLDRQLRDLGIGDGPPSAEAWRELLRRVEAVYLEADRARRGAPLPVDATSEAIRQRMAELEDAQHQLVDASRKVGMADVAASVLHNVGNVLNSVNTSTTMIASLVRSTSHAGLGKCLALLRNQHQPGAFLDADPKGKKVLPYLVALDKTLGEERDRMLAEVDSLAKNVEHIKQIVSKQLAAAKGDAHATKVVESVDLGELLEDAIQVASAAPERGCGVRFEREIEVRVIETDRHKLLQIVMNLVGNARDAIVERPGAGLVRVATRAVGADSVLIEVGDDGCGIAKETLGRIFRHGFTTKAKGHGFGLHGSACAAIELGGTLTATSDGPGRGATFRLVLPTILRAGRRTNTVRLPLRRPEATP